MWGYYNKAKIVICCFFENGALFWKTNINSMKIKYLVVFTRSHEHFGFVNFDNEDRSKYVALPFKERFETWLWYWDNCVSPNWGGTRSDLVNEDGNSYLEVTCTDMPETTSLDYEFGYLFYACGNYYGLHMQTRDNGMCDWEVIQFVVSILS